MAIAGATLVSVTKSDSGGSFTSVATASASPAANNLILLDVFHTSITVTDAQAPTSVAGAGLTFTLVDAVVDTAAGATLSRWRALSASPSTGAITVTLANATASASVSVHQYSGVNTGGTNGSSAIVQTVKNSNNTGSVATVTATLAAFGSANNGASGANSWFNLSGSVPTATPDSGWTELHDTGTTFGGATLANAIETQWRATNDTTALATWSANGAVYAIASEIAAAVAVAVSGRRSLLGVGV